MAPKLTSEEIEHKINALEKEVQELKGKKEALRGFEELYHSLLETSPYSIAILNQEGLTTYVNPVFERTFGWSRNELLGKRMDLIPENKDVHLLETECLTRSGETLNVQFGSFRLRSKEGRPKEQLVFMQDITERKRAEKALRESEEKYRLIVDNAITPIIYFDLDGHVQLVNAVGAKNLGGTASDYMGKSVLEILPDFADETLERINKIKETGLGFEVEDVVELPWGKSWFLTSVQPVKDTSGEIIAIQLIGVDITDRKQMEQALRESEEKARALLNATTDMAVLMDTEGVMLAINKAGAEKIGKTVDDLVGTCSYEYFSPGLAESRKVAIDKVIQTGEPLRNEDEDEGLVLDQNIYPMFDERGDVNGVAVFLLDITERRRAEEELIERKKELESKTIDLEEMNTALRVLLKKREEDKTVLEEKVLFSVKDLIFPYLEKLKISDVDHRQKTYLNIIESNLNDIVSPFMTLRSSKLHRLTPTEIHVANLVKQGRSTKEIAEILNLAISTINSHRDSIRRKLGINKRKINLRTHLISDSTDEISYI